MKPNFWTGFEHEMDADADKGEEQTWYFRNSDFELKTWKKMEKAYSGCFGMSRMGCMTLSIELTSANGGLYTMYDTYLGHST